MSSRRKQRRIGWFAFGLVLAAQGAAAEIGLELPIACRPGVDCWVVNYVDLDHGPGVRDYACGRASYDGHKGVDFAVRDLALVAEGVPVRAAQAGEVQRVRDGMADATAPQGPAGGDVAGREGAKKHNPGDVSGARSFALATDVAGRECGNGVVIGHGQGWTTQYCHLRKGSIAVKPGQRVAAGEAVGMVGQSGLAEFSHVHFQVAKNGTVVDPFRGVEPGGEACGLGTMPLWSAPARVALSPYRPSAIYNGGFTAETPDPAATRRGLHREATASASAPTLIAWADIFWVEAGDRIRVRLFGPNGEILVDNTQSVEKLQARRFTYAGARRKAPAWPVGIYRAEIVVLRDKDGQTAEAARFAHAIEVR
ncbi:MAG: M23 family metallopeptidase [Rhodospirillales bacterium]|nr:M23 family metallopeptidase [Rhodospirillales bacterium]MSP80333.1 M23 family metallopeptidase [Rhodospirillales bacterium]